MDKIFTFNRAFICFCALLIVAVVAAHYIRDQRILEEAKIIGRQEAEWSWPSQGVSTNVDDIQAKILKLTENDAEVEVRGKQKIFQHDPHLADQSNTQPVAGPESKTNSQPSSNPDSTSVSDFKAVLTLYKHGNSRIWLIGKVEGQ